MTPVVVVTGLSGAGKASALRMLEDLGYEAVDNLPLTMVEELIRRADRAVAVGLDIRSRGFDVGALLAVLDRLRAAPSLSIRLLFMRADHPTLLRRFTETRRRHPISHARVTEGIDEEVALTEPLRDAADVTVDTSDMPLPRLRALMADRFTLGPPDSKRATALQLTLMSFAFPAGLPREADMVFDARFLRNPHYDPILRPRTGCDPEVAAFVEADPDFGRFFASICGLLDVVLPRFVQEGKKYATIAVGCSGGRHRSVRIVERLHPELRRLGEAQDGPSWTVTTVHRELTKLAHAAMGTLAGPGGMAPPGSSLASGKA